MNKNDVEIKVLEEKSRSFSKDESKILKIKGC